jgi:cytochrome oxidase Cu insertion factor (SCO1/SenC/PrrC family)
MGSMGSGGSTALAGDLYVALRWQLLVLVVVVALVALVALVLPGRNPGTSPVDSEPEPRGRRILRVSLGMLWVVAGLLQAQPAMPASFVPVTLVPALDASPGWLFATIDPFIRLWLQHPVAADAVTVWIQVGLGVAVLLGGTGRVARGVLVASAAWAGFVWIVGEVLGGLTDPSASWLRGAPGAALFYVAASVVLLMPATSWSTGSAGRWLRRTVGATFVLGAVLQALPRSGYWSPTGLFSLFSDVAVSGVPGPMAAPIQSLAQALPPHATLANAVVVAVLGLVGIGLLVGAFPRSLVVAGSVVSVLGWWLGQGLGVFGGTSTDPNSGIVVVVMLVASWPWPEPDTTAVDVSVTQARSRLVAWSAAAMCLAVLPLVAGLGLLGPQTAQAAVGDSGGVMVTTAEPAPEFRLMDQDGRTVRMSDLRGTLTLVVFLDPVCFDSCPLIANQLATSVRDLGADAASVSIVAVDVNPVFSRVADVHTFTTEHGLDSLPGWHFVTGPAADVSALMAAYGEGISVPNVGMIGHPQSIYLFGRNGDELEMLTDTANDDLVDSYVALITSELRRHL